MVVNFFFYFLPLFRTGQTSAVVEIRLDNTGDRAYRWSSCLCFCLNFARSDLYGESITVVRSVTNSSSTYKLKDHRGKVVVDKKVKEELDRILMSFNIQVRRCWWGIIMAHQLWSDTTQCDESRLHLFWRWTIRLLCWTRILPRLSCSSAILTSSTHSSCARLRLNLSKYRIFSTWVFSWRCVKQTTTLRTSRRAPQRDIWRRRRILCQSWKGSSTSNIALYRASKRDLITFKYFRWEKKYEFHQNLNVRKNDVKRKKGELAWAVVRDAEIEAVEVEKAAEDQGKKVVCITIWFSSSRIFLLCFF